MFMISLVFLHLSQHQANHSSLLTGYKLPNYTDRKGAVISYRDGVRRGGEGYNTGVGGGGGSQILPNGLLFSHTGGGGHEQL